MPHVRANGIRLAYERTGHGDPVLLIMGSSAGGRAWTTHQTPALNQAGYGTVTFDNRGVPPSEAPPGQYSMADLVADTEGLIEALGLGPCRLVGTSLGAMIAQELARTRPDLVRAAALVATRARSDAFRRAQTAADRALAAAGVELPPAVRASRAVLEMFSPATLRNDTAVTTWLDVFELSGGRGSDGQRWIDTDADRREALREVGVPCRVIAFSDDVVCPPHLAAEVADCIPDCDFVEIRDCGHLGFLERPNEVNAAIIEFFGKN